MWVVSRATISDVDHPLAPILREAAHRAFPDPDGIVEFGPGLDGFAIAGVFAFTAHFFVAADIDREAARARLAGQGFSGPLSVSFLDWLSREVDRAPTTHDVVFAGHGDPSGPPSELVQTDEFSDHPRVQRAIEHRTDTHVFTDSDRRGVLIVGRGVCGRWEAAFEVDEDSRGKGIGRRLIAAACSQIPAGAPLFIQVAPGNVASVRSVIAAGYSPIGAEVLFWK